ncbi:MAG: response regulator transcription factor [Thermoleophilia bacterium]|nr:response regulator transcription factor [Thermoleophilia bacterium]
MATPIESRSSEEQQQIRVVIVDDHALVREGVRSALSLSPEMLVVGEAADGFGALQILEREPADVVLLDLHMPRMDGFACLEDIRKRWPQLPVIVLTVDEDREVALQAIRRGATAYVPKFVSPADLVSVVRQTVCGAVLVGGRRLAALIAEAPEEKHETTNELVPHGLTERELQVLGLLAQGKSNADIAQTLFVTTKTVKYHLTNIFSKLGVHNRTEAAAFALRHGMGVERQTHSTSGPGRETQPV